MPGSPGARYIGTYPSDFVNLGIRCSLEWYSLIEPAHEPELELQAT